MAVYQSERILRRNAFEVLKQSRETGESVILTRDGKPEIIMLTFDDYVRLQTGNKAVGTQEIKALDQVAVDSTVCMRNCPFRAPKPGSVRRLQPAKEE